MKTLLALLVLSLGTSAFAKVVHVDVPGGYKVIEVSSSIWHSGCGNTTNFLDVLKTENGYVAGHNVAIKHDGEVWENVMPGILPGPINTCMAYVKTTTKAKFKHFANGDEVVAVEIPEQMDRNLEIKVTDVKLAH